MGFYGNITNTSRTQFQFDKIYPNRKEMEQKILTDGIYLNRYVLIEYDSNISLDNMKRVWIKPNGFHISNSEDNSTLLKEGDIAIGDLVYTAIASVADNANPRDYTECIFYICTGFDKEGIAQFDQVVDGSNNTPLYTVNYNIDIKTYGAGRGYDSTVWQKVFVDSNEKYVMIAELNTVVPTFAVTPDAPTMNPIEPHFDTQSTDVYYKLHWQAPWGFRVKETAADKSDEDTTHTTTTYDPNTGKNNIVTREGIPAAIYFNEAAFNAQIDENRNSAVGINKHSNAVMLNEIKVEPTGKSGNKYNDHEGQSTQSEQVDIQEMTINLPAIGNMMSDAWDLIHGPRRNNDMREIDPNTGEYVASLKGRLNSIDAIASDEIPVKRHDNGQLIGSKINGGKADEDDKTGIDDDAWIETIVDAATNTISIHHKFNRTKNGNTFTDLREAEDWGHDTTDSIDMNSEEDSFDIVTPIIDDMGHIVGENTQTVTLPYGFKTIKTNGRSNEVAENATGTPAAANIVADKTKDELAINSGNKWIRIDTDATGDSLTIRHDVHNTSSDEATTDWTKTEANTTIPVVTYDYDEAGHYTKHHTENYQLPFGYGKIKGDSGDTAATATYDELTFTSDEWLTATVSEDKVTYSHDYPKKVDDTTSEYNVNGKGDTVVLETLTRDEKGHVIKVNQNTVTLPYGYKTFKDSETTPGQSIASSTQDIMTLQGDTWVKPTVSNDLIKINHIGPVTATHTSKANVTPKFGDNFTIEDHYYDNKGHIYTTETHTVTMPKGSLTDNSANGADVITQLAFNDSIGALSTTRTNIGNLKMTGYELPTSISTEALNANESLNSVLGKLEYRLNKEIADRTTAINNLDYTETADNTQIITQITQTDGKITNVARAAAGTLVLGSNYSKATTSSALTTTDSLNTAFGKIEKSLDDTNARITNLIGGDKLNSAFDTLKEVSDWLVANDSGADKVIDDIATLNADSNTQGSVDYKITNEINKLNVADTSVSGKYVSSVSETNGKISVTREDLPTYTLASGDANGTVKFNNNEVKVAGLGSAAYTNSNNYATAEQGNKADSALQADTTFDYNEEKKTISELFDLVAQLSAEVTTLRSDLTTLQNKVNEEHPTPIDPEIPEDTTE